ncbi:MAG: hypothetical protein JJU18_01870 [Oceanicaulis sp.]|nr:hypothetical protein [Oceanicaulis sp.]
MPETLFSRALALAGLFAAVGLTAVLAAGSASAQSIAVGQSINGELTSSDPQLGDGSHFDCYNLQTRAGERLQIDQTSAAFDSFLMVRRGGCSNPGDLIAYDDDGGDGLDSRLVLQGDGTVWALIANSAGAGATGRYQLRVSAAGSGQTPAATAPQLAPPQTLAPPQPPELQVTEALFHETMRCQGAYLGLSTGFTQLMLDLPRAAATAEGRAYLSSLRAHISELRTLAGDMSQALSELGEAILADHPQFDVDTAGSFFGAGGASVRIDRSLDVGTRYERLIDLFSDTTDRCNPVMQRAAVATAIDAME